MQVNLFDRAGSALEVCLQGDWRRRLLDSLAGEPSLGQALARMRTSMESHSWSHPDGRVDLSAIVSELDQTTRRVDGLHVLHDWDGKAARVTPKTIAGDVADFIATARAADAVDRTTLAIALDFYFLYLLAILAIRAWDTGEPGANLDRVTGLLRALQSEQGGGQRFADNAETLLLIATSHYEPNETGYATLLDRGRSLPSSNRLAMALTHAQAMGSHLRFGYEITYAQDIAAMRADNGADYPWLGFGLAWLMDAYEEMRATGQSGESRTRVVEAIINGLTPDPEAFLVRRPNAMAAHAAEYDRFAAGFDRVAGDLIAEFDAHRPRDQGYSPIALFYNFSINVLKGFVVDALMRGQATPIGLNDMFTGVSVLPELNDVKARLARTLMGYARARPDEIGGRRAPVIVYDPVVGRRAFGAAVRVAKQRGQKAEGTGQK